MLFFDSLIIYLIFLLFPILLYLIFLTYTKITNKKEKQKYNRIKNYAYISSFVILIESIILFIR